MYPRVEYEMTEEDLKELLESCRPTPVMFLSGGTPIGSSPQENANRAWARLGKKMGFDSMTVQPIGGKGQRFFTAVPNETEEQKQEREKQKAEEERLSEIERLNTIIKVSRERIEELSPAPRKQEGE